MVVHVIPEDHLTLLQWILHELILARDPEAVFYSRSEFLEKGLHETEEETPEHA